MGIRDDALTVPRTAGRDSLQARTASRCLEVVARRALSVIGEIEYASLEISPIIRASLESKNQHGRSLRVCFEIHLEPRWIT